MANLGTTELIIILVIVFLLFGVGRVSKIAGELGSGIRAFQEGLRGGETEDIKDNSEDKPSTDTT
ncbi:MAG: twin-arginine translocase TatA/TatE family subunit [Anaerolineales bacterium]|nr:twin-arginine translocase TatA/TatE family subunit [Anaerolineales bacterium]MBS3753532.1 twin-arginine translocase TatA/TatE family subunit [Anaerolineales bacterium]